MIPIVAAVVLASAAEPHRGVLPSGTYSYQVFVEGKPVATSKITIAHESGSLQATETTVLQGDPVTTTRTVDPTTFSTLKWDVNAQASEDTIEIASGNATWAHGPQTKTLSQAVPGPSIVFDFFAGAYPLIPAMLHATGAKTFNVYGDFTDFDVKAATVIAATATPPPGVPKSDAVAAFQYDDAIVTLWYNPTTFVLDAMDAPKAQFRIQLLP